MPTLAVRTVLRNSLNALHDFAMWVTDPSRQYAAALAGSCRTDIVVSCGDLSHFVRAARTKAEDLRVIVVRLAERQALYIGLGTAGGLLLIGCLLFGGVMWRLTAKENKRLKNIEVAATSNASPAYMFDEHGVLADFARRVSNATNRQDLHLSSATVDVGTPTADDGNVREVFSTPRGEYV